MCKLVPLTFFSKLLVFLLLVSTLLLIVVAVAVVYGNAESRQELLIGCFLIQLFLILAAINSLFWDTSLEQTHAEQQCHSFADNKCYLSHTITIF